MTIKERTTRILLGGVAAIGLTLGVATLAGAATTPAQPTPPAVQDQATPGDEAVDGVDHQFEGEEIGNNGDGIPDPNEANEVETPEANEVTTAPAKG
ncbi:MAG: hypothetical protein ACT452_02865 [Microthrixaceae bacterium]